MAPAGIVSGSMPGPTKTPTGYPSAGSRVWHPHSWVETQALDPKRRRRGRATGLDHFELVTDMQGPLLDDPHDDCSPAGDPEGAFNIQYER